MSKILSIIALSGDKAAAVASAADDLFHAVVFAVRDGNKRNLTDTIEALRAAGAVRKDGALASNKKGVILECLLSAANAAESARLGFSGRFMGHKGKPTAVMTETAQGMACAIAAEFEAQAGAALAPKLKGAPSVPETDAGAALAPKLKGAPSVPETDAGAETDGAAETDAGAETDGAAETGQGPSLSFLRRIITVYQMRLAKRDRHIAQLEAELSALREVTPSKAKQRKAA